MAGVADTLQVNMEKVRPDVPALYEAVYKNTAYSLLSKGGEKHQITKTVNGTDFRVPLQIQPPGIYAALNMDGGAFATGTSVVTKQMYQTYFPTQLAVKMTLEQIKTTENSSLSVLNVWKQNMKQALPNFQRYADVSFHNITGSQGLVAQAIAVGSVTTTVTYTMDYEFGVSLLQQGMPVEIFDSTLGTQRTTGLTPSTLPYITAINRDTNQVTIGGLGSVTGFAATDYFALPGVGATPAWMNGLYYFNSTTTTGNLLGLSRTTVPELNTPNVNAAGALVPMHGILLKARMRQRTGEYPGKLRGLIHEAQAAQIAALGISITEFQRGKTTTVFDPVPAYEDGGESINFAQVNHLIDIHASKKRIDWVNLDAWGRVYLVEPTFYKEPGTGRMVFDVRDSSGNVLAAVQYYMYCAENFYCAQPNSNGFIYGLTVDPQFQSA